MRIGGLIGLMLAIMFSSYASAKDPAQRPAFLKAVELGVFHGGALNPMTDEKWKEIFSPDETRQPSEGVDYYYAAADTGAEMLAFEGPGETYSYSLTTPVGDYFSFEESSEIGRAVVRAQFRDVHDVETVFKLPFDRCAEKPDIYEYRSLEGYRGVGFSIWCLEDSYRTGLSVREGYETPQ